MNARHNSRILAARLGVAAACLLLIAGSVACSNILAADTVRFFIAVDSISAPASIAASDTLTARFFGKIGLNGCFRLERVERSRNAGLLEMRFHGAQNVNRNVACTQMPVMLDHLERVPPPLEGPFKIRVIQPNGSVLEKVVEVR